MAGYLMISNPGVADPTAFTLLGASTSRTSENGQTIGKFGSGNKHGVAVCLRHDLAPVVFAGSLRMTFGTSGVKVDTGLRTKTFARVNVKFGGKDRYGVQKSATEDLGFVLEYGASDWADVSLALREFVSNAIDRTIEEGESNFIRQWTEKNWGFDPQSATSADRERRNEALAEYRKTAHDWDNVKIELVNDNQVRAKDGQTRVFIPLNNEVLDFFANLGKWFLHFSEPHLINQTILPKKNRNLKGRTAAVVYRRGVRVREFESSEISSLFDYNLNNLNIDESRKVDDWAIRNAAARAIRDASCETLSSLFLSFGGEAKYWEHQFESYGLDDSNMWGESDQVKETRKISWQKAALNVLGDTGILATKGTVEIGIAARKGYKSLVVPEAYVKAAGNYGVKTVEKVVSQDDRERREIRDADPAAIKAVDFAWNLIELTGLTNGKTKPAVKIFDQVMVAGSQLLGFYRDGTVFLNSDITGADTNKSQQLLVTAMEECVHYTTGATDQSRDFQDYLLNLIVKLAV